MGYPTYRVYPVNHLAVTIASLAGAWFAVVAVGAIASAHAEPVQRSAEPPCARHLTEGDRGVESHADDACRAPPRAVASSDLDGVVLWLGPRLAMASYDGERDSLVGLELVVGRVREQQRLSLVGGAVGAARFGAADAGRVWGQLVVGSRPWGQWLGGSVGPLIELSSLARPKLGASVGVWVALGIVPFARLCAIDDRGVTAELGIQVPLPVRRW